MARKKSPKEEPSRKRAKSKNGKKQEEDDDSEAEETPPKKEEKPSESPRKSRGKDYELKFGSLEIVCAAGDLDKEDPKKKFFIGRLQDDVLMGLDKEADIGVEWFEYNEDTNIFEQGEVDELPVGSLVCAITKFTKEGFARGSDTLKVAPEAWEHAERKLAQQLEDDYDSDQDSQFGDEVVTKRLRQLRKGAKPRKLNLSKKGDDDEDVDDDGDDDDDDDDDAPKSRKRKGGKKASSPKKKKAARGLNPRPSLSTMGDSFAKKTGKVDSFDGDVERATKEVFRAVQSKDTKALKQAVGSASKGIFSLHYPRSVGLATTPFMLAMVQGNVEAVKIIMDQDAKSKEENNSGNENRFGTLQKCALPTLSTGKISGKHANYNRRKVGASRGGREGNNALLHDTSGDYYTMPSIDHRGVFQGGDDMIPFELHKYGDEHMYFNLFRDFDEIPDAMLDLLEASYSRTVRYYWSIENVIRGGQRLVAKRHIGQQLSLPYNDGSYNFLHHESLGDPPKDKKKPFSKDILARSVCKNSTTETRFSPLACACINPDPAYLEAMLKVAPEHASLLDAKSTSLLHYAAACEGPAPLEYLIKAHSLSRTSIDKRKETPLMYAARAARAKNIVALLQDVDDEQKKAMLTAKSSEGMAAIHFAAMSQRKAALDTVEALLDEGADPNLASTAARNKVSPVHLACRVGNLDVLKLLVEHGGKPAFGDKLKRSPLIHACMNGHTHVVSYLLVLGVDVDAADSSDNDAALYAAAYGYDDCLELLLDAGANPDSKNSWRTSPLSVAVQKGHHRVSSLLFDLPAVDVNFKNDEGKTLFFSLVEGFIAEKLLNKKEENPAPSETKGNKKKKAKREDEDPEMAELRREMSWDLQKLLDRSDVDLTVVDSEGQNVLHLLCSQRYPAKSLGEKGAITLAKLVLSRGLNVDSADSEGTTPLLSAATSGNGLLFEYLIKEGASLSSQSVNSAGKNICHFLLEQADCEGRLDLVEGKAGAETFHELLKSPDNLGFNPVHCAVRAMTGCAQPQYQQWRQLLEKLLDRFPDLAIQPVGPIALFTEPVSLAKLILEAPEEEKEQHHHYHWRSHHSPSGPQILSEADRSDPAKVQKALDKWETAIPFASEHVGKCLIHFVCEGKLTNRTKELLDWILPASKDVVGVAAGTDNDLYTPLQILLFKSLPASDLRALNPTGDRKKDRLTCLNQVLESIGALVEAGAEGLNDSRSGVFASKDDLSHHLKELTEEKDKESMKAIKRLAEAVVVKEEEEAKKEIVDVFQTAMKRRMMRFYANKLQHKDLSFPVAHTLAKVGEALPTSIWKSLAEDRGLDLKQTDENGFHVLHVSLEREDMVLSRFFCEQCPALVTTASENGTRPVHLAAKRDKPDLLRLVLKHLKDEAEEVNKGDSSGRTAFHYSVEKAASRGGEALDPCEIILLRAGARLDAIDSVSKRTPLHYCFLENASSNDHFNFPHSITHGPHDRVDLASSLLAAKGATKSVNMADKFGRTPLSYAAAYGSTVSSLLLVSKGADMFLPDDDGNTPINIAVLKGHGGFAITLLKSKNELPKLVDVVDLQREKKTDSSGKVTVEVVKKEVKSIVWHAIKQKMRGLVYILLDSSFPLEQAIIDALYHKSFQLARKLLNTSPPEVVRHVNPETKRNMLHELAHVKSFENAEWSTTLCKILLDAGIKVSDQSKEGHTPLHIAAARSHLQLVRLLVASDNTCVKILDKDGFSPLARFVRRLPESYLGEDACVEMVSLLTTGMKSLSDPQFNKVPCFKKDQKTISYDGISFELGPNKEGVMEEIMKRLGSESHEEAKPDKFDGFSTLVIQSLAVHKYKVFQKLVSMDAPLDMLDSNGLAALHHAALSNSTHSTSLLLRSGADPNVTTGDERKVTPLIVTSFQCGTNRSDLGVAKVLVRNKADVTKTCMVTGGNCLHFAARENNQEFSLLILRAALHANTKEAKGKKAQASGTVLVRLGVDAALYPAKKEGNQVTLVWETRPLPPASISESIDADGLCLDSQEALVRLRLKQTGHGGDIDAKLNQTKPGDADDADDADEAYEPKDGEGEGSDPEGSDPEEDRDSDEDEEEEEEEDPFVDDDSRHNNNHADEDDTTRAISQAKEVLLRYFGLESLLLGEKDEALLKPLKEKALVIVQICGPKVYANEKGCWMEGRVKTAHKNGTYDVDVFLGLELEGVVRQQLRPWKGSRVGTWPSPSKPSKTLQALLKTKDKQNHTPTMAAVKPVEFGAYEQTGLIGYLVEHGAEIDDETKALARPGSAFLQRLEEMSGSDVMDVDAEETEERTTPKTVSGLEPLSQEEFDEETKNAIIELEKRGLMKKKDEPPKVLPACELKAIGLHVLPVDDGENDETTGRFYDAVMTKVEVHQYGISENKYYKLQIVHDPTREIYNLVTNWGRVGDHGGQKQETPFGSRDEAVKEFTKVFKSKSGLLWEDYVTSQFEPKAGKYKPLTILPSNNESKIPDLLSLLESPEDHPDVVSITQLDSDVQTTMKALVDPKAITGAANGLGLQQEQLPLGRISIETLFEAEQKLAEVEKALEVFEKLDKPEELKEKRDAMDKVAVLSSEFFQLLPTKDGEGALSPLDKGTVKEQRNNIMNLKNLSVASSIVNAAFVKSHEVHPLDFAYRCLRATLDVLPKTTSARIGVEQYFRNTCHNHDLVISQVFQLHRHDEVSNHTMKNHRLLWHGTNRANVMGVIKEGLQIAPPQAIKSGNAFGDGVYFADMASKSWPYCRANLEYDAAEMPTAYLFLADVALGKQDRVFEANWGEKTGDETADSVWAVGYEGPLVDKDVVFQDSGVTVPLGDVAQNPKFKSKGTWKQGDSWWGTPLNDEAIEAIETARSSLDTTHPTKVETVVNHPRDNTAAEILLEHGPLSGTARVVPSKVRKVSEKAKDSDENGRKRRKGNEGKKIKKEDEENDDEENEDKEDEGENADDDNKEDDAEEDEDDYEQEFNEYTISRSEVGREGCVHYNEFIVADTNRINLVYLVEVTSRAWLEAQAKKKLAKEKK